MDNDTRSNTPKWIAVAVGVASLVTGVFVAAAKYHEIRKARAEADLAEKQAKLDQQNPTPTPPPVKLPTPASKVVDDPPPTNRKPGDVYVLKYGDPRVEMRFRWIPSGKFDRGWGEPLREVTISTGFWMAETECTQAQWRAIMKANPNPSRFKGDNLPVEQVSAFDADEFCKELARVTGKPIQLPSEAQWEYACRAGTKTEYHTGDGVDALKKAGWYSGNSGSKPHPVGELAANAWGLKDMHGNTWEWCQDWYDKKFYAESQATDPICTNSQTNPTRVLRGGSWGGNQDNCLAVYRFQYAPDNRSFGFRACFRQE